MDGVAVLRQGGPRDPRLGGGVERAEVAHPRDARPGCEEPGSCRQAREGQVAAIRPAHARHPVRVGEAARDEVRHDVLDVVDAPPPQTDVVGVGVGPPEASRPADVGGADRDAGPQEHGIQVRPAGTFLALGPAVQVYDDRPAPVDRAVPRRVPPGRHLRAVTRRGAQQLRQDGLRVAGGAVDVDPRLRDPAAGAQVEDLDAPVPVGALDRQGQDRAVGAEARLGGDPPGQGDGLVDGAVDQLDEGELAAAAVDVPQDRGPGAVLADAELLDVGVRTSHQDPLRDAAAGHREQRQPLPVAPDVGADHDAQVALAALRRARRVRGQPLRPARS